MDEYLEYIVPIEQNEKDVVIAWLDFYEFEVILEEEHLLKAYFNTTKNKQADIDGLADKLGLSPSSIIVNKIENQNWNKKWESNFDPINVDDKCYIRAQFHDQNKLGLDEILILPKMAFGTGHHETTYMMISEMHDTDIKNKHVLDYGCGTGILSVYAIQQGGVFVDAIDIETQSVSNSKEHFDLNGIEESKYKIGHGDLNILDNDAKYDCILANINRNVLLEKAEALMSFCNPEAQLFLSGILIKDQEVIKDKFTNVGFEFVKQRQKGDWLCFQFKTP